MASLFKRIKQTLKLKSRQRKFKRLNMGDYTVFNSPLSIPSKDTTIGKFCSIASNVKIGTSQHPINWLSTHVFQYAKLPLCPPLPDFPRKEFTERMKPCVIGNDVWIGTNVMIMDGVHVGDGAICAAGAVVTKDVPPYAIVGGVPAHIIRYRFDEKTIQRLLKVRWWDRPIEEIVKLPFDDVQACLKQLEPKKRQPRKKATPKRKRK